MTARTHRIISAVLGVYCALPLPACPAENTLDEIVVTAQRRAEDVQRTPVAITVLDAGTLLDAGVAQPQDLTYLVPGLQVAAQIAGGIYLRGVGNFGGNSLQDAALTFNFDGVYIPRQTTAGFVYDLERMEVLKGPQGTLYGRNATGGAINLLPRRPELGRFSGELSAEYGEYAAARVDGVLNAPLGEHAALRVAGQRVRRDGYMNEGSDDQDDLAGRLSLLVEANEDLTISVVADYYEQGGRGQGGTPLALGVENRIGVLSPAGGAYYQSQRALIAGRNFAPLPTPPPMDNHFRGVNVTIDWRTALGALTLIPAYRESHLDTSLATFGNIVTFDERDRQTSFEARLLSNPHPRLHTLAGIFYIDGSNVTPSDTFFRTYNEFTFSLQHPNTSVESAAVFGRVTWDVTDALRATLGARYTHEDKRFHGSIDGFQRLCLPIPTASCPNATPFPFPANITTPPVVFPPGALDAIPAFNPADGTLTVGFRLLANDTATISRTTWRAALEYDLAAGAMFYAGVETGFKSGGFHFSSDSQVFQPEFVEALTLGLKSRWLGDRLQANVELFDWRYEDQQVTKLSVDSRGLTNLRTENIGLASIRGVELGLQYLPHPNTLLSADLHYLDATYDSYRFSIPASGPPPVTDCSVTPVPGNFQIDCSGQRAPYAPEWAFALDAEQTFPLRSGARVVANGGARYQSDILVGLGFMHEQHQSGYWMLDASLTFNDAGNRYYVGAFGRNLRDETVMATTFMVPFSAFIVAALRPPRLLGLRAGVRF